MRSLPTRPLSCHDSYWNYPSGPLPRHYGREGVGDIHLCSKMPLPLTAAELADPEKLLTAPLPPGSQLWGLGMDKVYHPFFKVCQGDSISHILVHRLFRGLCCGATAGGLKESTPTERLSRASWRWT